MTNDPQKSEVHETTEDAGTSSATTDTPRPHADDKLQPELKTSINPGTRAGEPTKTENENVYPENTKIIRDESDDGGPIVIDIGGGD